MFLLEEIGVEAAMIIADRRSVAAIFVWAAGTMLVRWAPLREGRARGVRPAPASRPCAPPTSPGPSI